MQLYKAWLETGPPKKGIALPTAGKVIMLKATISQCRRGERLVVHLARLYLSIDLGGS